MKAISIRISDTQILKIKDIEGVVGVDFSKVVRAAIKIGLTQIQTIAAKDTEKAIDLVLINDARSK